MELIDRQALKNKLKRWDECDPYEFVEIVFHSVDDAPAIDAVPVVHGEWIHSVAVQGTTSGGVTYYHGYTCSVCGGLMGRKGDAYCYNCGARMDGGKDDKARA